MALSEHEQRVLEEMERALSAEDPRFVSAFRTTKLGTPRGRKAPLSTLALLAGLIGMGAGLVSAQAWLGILGFGLALAGVYGVLEAAMSPRAEVKPRSRKTHKSWSERANERFDRRRDS